MAINDATYEWDDKIDIQPDEPKYVVLEPGDYEFEIVDFQRQHFNGSANMPPCNKAALTLKAGGARISCNLFLTSSQVWKIGRLLECVGLLPKDSAGGIAVPWNQLKGAKGACSVKNRTYNDKTYNEVDRFLTPSEVKDMAKKGAYVVPLSGAAAPSGFGF